MRLVAVVVVLGLASCSGSEDAGTPATADASIDTATTDTNVALDTESPTDSTPTDVALDAVDPFGPYPGGPYGNKLGEVVANLAWEGYVSPLADDLANKKPYVTTSMDALRRDAKKGYALIHVSEFY